MVDAYRNNVPAAMSARSEISWVVTASNPRSANRVAAALKMRSRLSYMSSVTSVIMLISECIQLRRFGNGSPAVLAHTPPRLGITRVGYILIAGSSLVMFQSRLRRADSAETANAPAQMPISTMTACHSRVSMPPRMSCRNPLTPYVIGS